VPAAPHGGPAGADDAARPVRVDFSTSVNAYGPAPSVVAAVRAASDAAGIAAYPDPTCHGARAALAAHAGLVPDEVAVGAGAAELILAVALAFVRAGDRVVVPAHAFGEYARAAALCGGRVRAPARMGSGPAPPEAAVAGLARLVAAERPRVAFVCTPESPSGRAWPREAVLAVADACREAGTLLVVDQSYDAFAATSLGTPGAPGLPGVLWLRSLTKDHALAGIRVGYLAGPAALVAAVERARVPWSVSAPAQAAASAACTPEALAHVARTTAQLRAAAVDLGGACAALGVGVVPTDAHYFLLDVGDAARVVRAVRERHALRLRDCCSFGLPRHVRVAARTPPENALLVAAIADVASPSFSSPPPSDV
jgi:histidinol-phosphate/aromatic aminotransferase/cobyric acid decarboxylase-like protein